MFNARKEINKCSGWIILKSATDRGWKHLENPYLPLDSSFGECEPRETWTMRSNKTYRLKISLKHLF